MKLSLKKIYEDLDYSFSNTTGPEDDEYEIGALEEDYPVEFNIEEFKTLKSFNRRVKYCNQKLYRISSGSSRIVYKIDDEKVLKLAKNQKGLAQCEVEISYSHYSDIDDVIAKVFDYDENNLWVEMELAEKLTPQLFYEITGYDFKDFGNILLYESYRVHKNGRNQYESVLNKEMLEELWESDGFCREMLNFIPNYQITVAGDLARLSTYGVVNRNGSKEVVMIDYGLTSDVYEKYYP